MTASANNPAFLPQVNNLPVKSSANTHPSTLPKSKDSVKFSEVYKKSVDSVKDQASPVQSSTDLVNATKDEQPINVCNDKNACSQDFVNQQNGKQLPRDAVPPGESEIRNSNTSNEVLVSQAENSLTTAENAVITNDASYAVTPNQILAQKDLPSDISETALANTRQQKSNSVNLLAAATPLTANATSLLSSSDSANSNTVLSSTPNYNNELQYVQSNGNNLPAKVQSSLVATSNAVLSQNNSILSEQETLVQPASIGLAQKSTGLDIELNQKNNTSSFINAQQLFASLSNDSAQATASRTIYQEQLSATINRLATPQSPASGTEFAPSILLNQTQRTPIELSYNPFDYQDKEFNDSLDGLMNFRSPKNTASSDLNLFELNSGITKSLNQYVGSGNVGSNAPALTSLPSATINSALGSAAWSQDFNQQVAMFVQQDIKQAHIQLNPQHLGPMEIRISMGAEQQFNVSFNTHHGMVKDALDVAIPKLREMFEQQGLNLGDVSVSQQSQQQKHQNERFQNSPNPQTTLSELTNSEEQQQVIIVKTLKQGIVDIYA